MRCLEVFWPGYLVNKFSEMNGACVVYGRPLTKLSNECFISGSCRFFAVGRLVSEPIFGVQRALCVSLFETRTCKPG